LLLIGWLLGALPLSESPFRLPEHIARIVVVQQAILGEREAFILELADLAGRSSAFVSPPVSLRRPATHGSSGLMAAVIASGLKRPPIVMPSLFRRGSESWVPTSSSTPREKYRLRNERAVRDSRRAMLRPSRTGDWLAVPRL
jgi:hypothetical protein